MPTRTKRRRLLDQYTRAVDLHDLEDEEDLDEEELDDEEANLDDLEDEIDLAIPKFDWGVQKMRLREKQEPIVKKKYVGFNWWTYSASALGTFLILWWGLK